MAALLAAGCSEQATAAAAPDGTLVLEFGGGQASLAGLLQRYGTRMAAPRDYRSVRLPGETAPEAPVGSEAGHPGADPLPGPAPAPVGTAAASGGEQVDPERDPAAPAFFEVPLPKGKSLIHLAKQYLGDANRFRELLELNGWTEKDARTLREGTKVKIPKEPNK